jgi:DNA replication protein DnaC
MDRSFNPLPVCTCVTRQLQKEQKERERKVRCEKILRTYGAGLIDPDLKQASFQNFMLRKGTETAYQLAKEFAENIDDRHSGLYLYGPVGIGKSHLAAAIHNVLLQQGIASVFMDVSQLFGLARNTYRASSQMTEQDYIRAAIDCELLTLDEIGLTPLSEYEFKILFQILNGRKGKLTNFTSNLNLSQLERWFQRDRNGRLIDEHGRLFDRLLGSTDAVEMRGESYRKYLAMERLKKYRGM